MDLSRFNEQQRRAIEYSDGPLLILAGAGSGKTSVLTTKIAYLIKEKNYDYGDILAITFTNKAAKEMKERVYHLLHEDANKMQVSTFHSFGLQILKIHANKLGYKNNFTILDSDDTLALIKKIMIEKNINPKEISPKAIKNAISSAKNELQTAADYEKYASDYFNKMVYAVYRRYEEKLKLNNSFDFDDLLIKPILIFENYPEVLKYYQLKYKYVLIDEYQDTNHAQYVLTKKIVKEHERICVVGDENQSIYSFRGSNYKNILNFEKDYPSAQVIMLEQNYRSTQTILKAANSVIINNKSRKEKKLWTTNQEGIKINYKRCSDEKSEAYYVVSEIKKMSNYKEIAILYRTNAQARNIEEELRRNDVPFKTVGGFNYYNRAEIKDLLAYLKLIYNTDDDLSLTRIINVPKRKIGDKTIANIQEKANSLNTSLYKAIDSGKELIFKNLIEELINNSNEMTLSEFVSVLIEKTEIKKELELDKDLTSYSKIENIEEFISVAKNFEEKYGTNDLGAFLDEISLISDVDSIDNKNYVHLMTVHSAKGLEFDNVFIIGMEENLFPHQQSLYSTEDMEEERRLCYVAITRAKEKLWITNAQTRTIFGKESYNSESRFIKEIDEDTIEKEITEKANKFIKHEYRDEEYSKGDKILHEKYGLGVIVSVGEQFIDVAFPVEIGLKSLIKGHKTYKKV